MALLCEAGEPWSGDCPIEGATLEDFQPIWHAGDREREGSCRTGKQKQGKETFCFERNLT